MISNNRILLDRVVAGPVAAVLNLAAAVLGKILRREHSVEPDRTKQVVVAKLVGMGSTIQATPLLRALRTRYPSARLTFLTLKSNRALVERLDVVDEVLCLDDSGVLSMIATTTRALLTLMRRRVDHYLDLELYSRFAGLLALCSLARNRGGFYRYTARYRLGIYTHLVYFNTRYPVRRTYLQLGKLFGADSDDDTLSVPRVEEADRFGLELSLPELSAANPTPYVVVNPNASDLRLERRWPISHVALAMRQLAEAGVQIVLTGSPSEVGHVQQTMDAFDAPTRSRVINSAGRLTVEQLLALLDGAAVVLTNDSGPMHMAVALGRPTVSLFGPAHPDHYGIEAESVLSVYAAVPCSPCVHEVDDPPCRGDNVCMQRISPDAVVLAVQRLLGPRGLLTPERTGANRLPLLWSHPDRSVPLGTVSRTTPISITKRRE